jgi:hypothetical protein
MGGLFYKYASPDGLPEKVEGKSGMPQWERSPQRGDPTLGRECRKMGGLGDYKNSFFEGAKRAVFRRS